MQKAIEILNAAAGHMRDRAATYDAPTGEHSIPAVVDAFKAVTGVEMTYEQGWLFMALVKLVRSQQGDFKLDNYEDAAAYVGLAGEQRLTERTTSHVDYTIVIANQVRCQITDAIDAFERNGRKATSIHLGKDYHDVIARWLGAPSWRDWKGLSVTIDTDSPEGITVR